MEKKLKLAILDMNAGKPNQGLRCIDEIVSNYHHILDYEIFEVRKKHQIPDMSFDIYISSGGPGDPREVEGVWEEQWQQLFLDIRTNNLSGKTPKFVFFICHSFQLACRLFDLATITQRKSTSFGILPVHKTFDGMTDPILAGLDDPFFVVESRDYQIVQPDIDTFRRHGATIICLEKIRPHVSLERAIMSVRFSEYMFGTQFHPEADPEGMKVHFNQEDNRRKVIKAFGPEKLESMLDHLDDEDKIKRTHATIIPNFIEQAVNCLQGVLVLA